MKEPPVVSIFLTSFNHQDYVAAAIESVLSQDYSNFELLILDDCSTDLSQEIIRRYHDERILLHQNKFNTCASGFGQLLDCFRGEYIAIHHSDDIWEPTKLSEQVEILQQAPEIGACFTHVTVIDQDGRPIDNSEKHYTDVFQQHNKTRHEWLRHLFYRGNALCHPSVLIRKRCYEEIGTYNEGLYQLPDYQMWIRLCLRYGIEVIPRPLTRFRVNTEKHGSMSAPSLDNIVRHRHEIPHALEAFCAITLDDLIQAFPEAECFQGTPAQDSVVNYMLAMIALTSKSSTHAHRSFGANLLTRCWMDDGVREKLYSVHGLTRHQLRNPEVLVDHANIIEINQLKQQLVEVTSQPLQGGLQPTAASPMQALLQEIEASTSSAFLKDIHQSISERSFHLFNHILYDIRTIIGTKPCTYLEIGSYCGASALLMLAHPLPTDVICVDPLDLPQSHFNGSKPQDQTLYENLQRLGKRASFEIIKSGSQDPSLIEALYQHDLALDILFIDGDHRFAAVVADFLIYEPLVKPGGFIVFDDYHDHTYSPDVQPAVNILASKLLHDPLYEVLGLIPDLQSCGPNGAKGNEFVIYKRNVRS